LAVGPLSGRIANMKKPNFAIGEYYHIFNRGVDKRKIFSDKEDLFRFFQSMDEFNSVDPIGSLYKNSFCKNQLSCPIAKSKKLVEFIAYCLNPNHYHFILKELVEGGISEFMKRMGGYTWHFNKKYDRSGALFQGNYKAVHIISNEYLLRVSAYVNLNDKVHQLSGPTAKLSMSSRGEFSDNKKVDDFCKKGIILGQFKNKKEYKRFALEALEIIKENKEMKKLTLE
jgi:hypothetical protein